MGIIKSCHRHRRKTAQKPLLERYENTRTELLADDWFSHCSKLFIDALAFTPCQVLCLGLGSPSTSVNARAQLAFILQLSQQSDIDPANVLLYDPIFTEEDLSMFRTLELTVLNESSAKSAYEIRHPTIVFMPHCDRNLYEAVFAANPTLNQMVLIANHIQDYLQKRVLFLPSFRYEWQLCINL